MSIDFLSLAVSDVQGLAPYVLATFNETATVDLGRSATPIYEALLQKRVIVRPLGGYGMPHHLRISVGTQLENARFLDVLSAILNEEVQE